MQYTSQNLCWSRTLARAILLAVQTRPAAALATGLQLALSTGGGAINPDTVYADLTEAAFSGYARITLPIPALVVQEDIDKLALLIQGTFVAAAATPFVAETIKGYFITDAGNDIFGGEVTPDPFPISAAGDFLTIDATWVLVLTPETVGA